MNVPFITYFSLVNAIPKSWKANIKNYQKVEDPSTYNVKLIQKTKSVNKTFYSLFVEHKYELPLNAQSKWSKDLNIEISDEEWKTYYK